MTPTFTSDWIKSLLTFPFRDPRWREKALIGSLVAFAGFIIPVLPWMLLSGYFAQVARPILRTGAEPSLPEWDDWGQLLMDGLRQFGVSMVYLLPLMVLLVIGYVGLIGPVIAAAIWEESGRAPDIAQLLLPLLGTFGGLALFGVAMLLGITVGILLPPALMHVVAQEQFAAAFRFGEWWPILRANLSGFLIAYVLILALSFAVSFALQFLYLTIVLCCLLPFVLAAYSAYHAVISAALYAQTYRAGVQKLNVGG